MVGILDDGLLVEGNICHNMASVKIERSNYSPTRIVEYMGFWEELKSENMKIGDVI